MLDRLGIDGMSSDDSDIDAGGLPQYRVTQPLWRAGSVGTWLRALDVLYLMHRRESGTTTRGAFPRRRLVTLLSSSSNKFVPGLPINAYKPTWLRSRLEVKNTVRPNATPYLFLHSSAIQEYVFCSTKSILIAHHRED